MRTPPRLRPGDVIGVVGPASPPPDPKNIDRGITTLERLGFKTKQARYLRERRGYLAGTDRQRASDLMELFLDPEVRAIVCVRGGYGTTRLVPRLDFDRIRANPKIFVGFSDITAVHCALLRSANLVCFHGPMLNSGFARADLEEFAVQGFLRTLTRAEAAGSVCQGYEGKTIDIVRRGRASGRLVGGNLSMLCATIGTAWQPAFRDSILVLEDIEEPPYRFDRMLTHLLNAGLLQQVQGIAIGVNRNCLDPKAVGAKEYRQTVEDVIRERLRPLGVPVVQGLPFGHVRQNATLPLGVGATLDAVKGDLVVTEAAVK
jgi:muramoyltetrapeptide carboxypeptidase